MKLPTYLTTVTPLSRYLATFLFIFLPLAGFLFGFYYGQVVSWSAINQESAIPPLEHIDPLTPGDPIPNSPINPPESNPTDDNESISRNPGESAFEDEVRYPKDDDDETKSTEPTLTPYTINSCGITNCHGTEVTCGKFDSDDVMCTMEYRVGDFCRQYVTCGLVDDTCTPIKDTRYETCVSCVEECNKKDDPTEAFSCEDECRMKLQ